MADVRLEKVGVRPKWEAFAREFLKDCNGAAAARRAGYSAKTADRIAPRLLRRPAVRTILEAHARRSAAEIGLEVRRLEVELARQAFFDPLRLFDEVGALKPVKDLDEDTRRALVSVEVEEIWAGRGEDRVQVGVVRKLRWHNKVQAIELALKRLGLLVEKHEITVPQTVTINIGCRALAKK